MFSSNSSPKLKVVGTAGHSAESLRQEVARGAKFVIYSYNISLLVVSFKRPSNIYFIRPGESRVFKGLPFTLISLVFGWWGIPWGIVYTIQSLYTNLGGGTDVTASLLASHAPPPAPPPPARPVSPRRILATAGVVVGLAVVVYVCVCFSYGQNLPVALIAGTKMPYTVELNGTSYKLRTGHPEVVKLAEGDFVLRGAPGEPAELHFSARTEFLARPFNRHVLVVNPDRLAVVYRSTVSYHPAGAAVDPNEQGVFDLYANRLSYELAEPDYFVEDFPQNISMPSGTSTVTKSRVAAMEDTPLESIASLISGKLGYDALRDYLGNRARLEPEGEHLQRLIIGELKPDDARALFEAHLGDRPLLMEWHRAYQYFMDRSFPSLDLVSAYRSQMTAAPENGALTYLYARLLRDPAESGPLYAKALHVKQPSLYAAYALAFDAFIARRFQESLDYLARAKRGGLDTESLRLCERDTLLALGRKTEVLAAVKERRRQSPADTELFADELLLTQSQSPDRSGGQRAITAFVTTLRSRFARGDYQPVESYLRARLSYALGDEREAAGFGAKLQGPLNQFEAAVDGRNHQAAAKAVAALPQLPARYFWLLMLTAHTAGDSAAADRYFQQALERLATEGKDGRAAVAHINGNSAADHAALLLTPNYAGELRIFFTALGVRFPVQRESYFARARELDHDPAFPHLLLTAVRQAPMPATQP